MFQFLFPILGIALIAVFPSTPDKPAAHDAPPQAAIVPVNTFATPVRLSATLPDSILRAEQAAAVNIDYTPGDEKTWYFDGDGAPVDKATAGGYYRVVLGKTADGRSVIQDFYQDSGRPQTAPVILKKDAEQHDFDSSTSDSKIVWFREDGSVLATQDYKGGVDLGRGNFYQNGILAAQTALPFDVAAEADDPFAAVGEVSRGNRYYYPDGKIMAFEYIEDADNFELLYYRADGSPLLHRRSNDEGRGNGSSTWNADGSYAAQEEVQPEIDAVTARIDELTFAMRTEQP